jgi:DNA modification methylase
MPGRFIGPYNETTVWDIGRDRNAEGGHATQKPIECMARPIRNHEGNVYDPFIGSGTTMVAAEQLHRVCYGMDISPAYVAVTLERMANLGLEPRLV